MLLRWFMHITRLAMPVRSSLPFIGRQPRLPVDLVLGSFSDRKEQGYNSFAENLRKSLLEAYAAATTEADKARDNQKRTYDTRARGGTVEPGDRVLVKVLAHEGRHKLCNRWEKQPYRVVEKPNSDIPVFVVRREDGQGGDRTLHRNQLLPISTLPVRDRDERVVIEQVRTPVKKPTREKAPADKGRMSNTVSDRSDDAGFILFLESPESPGESDSEGESGEYLEEDAGASFFEGGETEDLDNGEADISPEETATTGVSDARSSDAEHLFLKERIV